VEAILLAWHEAKITGHLEQLAGLRDSAGDVSARLEAVLEAYALMAHRSITGDHRELAPALHQGGRLTQAERHLHAMVSDLVAEGAASGAVRDDVIPAELASYCLSALAGASSLPSSVAVRRLVKVTLAGLRPTGSSQR
ncbi:MAG: TetR/AcrR family transcriptional regulator, partial [Acidimicrobiales bacterium]